MILAADIGSTWLKAGVFTPDGKRSPTVDVLLDYVVRTADRAEIDPDRLRETFLDLVDRALAAAGCNRAELRRIAITSQAQTFCVCDATGKARTPLIGWTDTRATHEAAALQQRLGARFHETTGFPEVSPHSTLAKVAWLDHHGRLPRDPRIVHVASWLAMALGAPHAIDANLAAMSGFYSIRAGDWWPEAVDSVGIETGGLGGVVKPGGPLPTDARPADFSPSLEVVLAANDHTAGAVAGDCRPGHSMLTLGTAGVIYRHAGDGLGPFSSTGVWGPYPSGGSYELRFLSHACSALDWADALLFGTVDSPRFVDRAVSTAVDRRRAPFFHPSRMGGPAAWTARGTPDTLAYATLEGIAFALRELAGDDTDGTLTVLGGGSRLEPWVQILADVFDLPLLIGGRDGIDGAAALAGVPLRPKGEPRVVAPDAARRQLLDHRFQQWQAAVEPGSVQTMAVSV